MFLQPANALYPTTKIMSTTFPENGFTMGTYQYQSYFSRSNGLSKHLQYSRPAVNRTQTQFSVPDFGLNQTDFNTTNRTVPSTVRNPPTIFVPGFGDSNLGHHGGPNQLCAMHLALALKYTFRYR